MFVSSLLDHKQYGGYFAFLLASVIIMYEQMDHLHRLEVVGVASALLACGAFMYQDNTGLFVLLGAFFIQSVKMYKLQQLKNRALP